MHCGTAAAIVCAFIVALAPRAQAGVGYQCDKIDCYNRGICERKQSKHTMTHTCRCFDGYTVADCSTRTCPVGPAWVGYSKTTDGLHSQNAECSNVVSLIPFSNFPPFRLFPYAVGSSSFGHQYFFACKCPQGVCDRDAGVCVCAAGYHGPAC